MNILVIHEVSYDSKVVYEYQDFAERLAGRGHSVFVIDFDETGECIGPPRSVSRTGVGTVRVFSTPCVNKPILRFLTGRLLYPNFLRDFIREHAISAIWMYSVFVNGEKTIEVAKSEGVPVIFRALDVYHQVRQNPLIKYPLLLGEKFIYKNASHVSVTNLKMANYIRRVSKDCAEPSISVLSHGVDTQFFSPRQRDEEFSRRAGLKNESKVILFLGTLYPFSGLNHLLTAFHRHKSSHPNVKFVLVGDGEQEMLLRTLVTNLNLQDDVYFAGRAPYDEVPRWLSLADVTVTPFEINSITRDIVPIKSLQYLAMGKPLVSAPIPDVMSSIPQEVSGTFYQDISDPESFLQKTMGIAENSTLSRNLGQKAREYVATHFSIDETINKLEALIGSTTTR